MSIYTKIVLMKSSGEIFELNPRSRQDTCYRRLFLTPELKAELDREQFLDVDIKRFAEPEADLEVFINRKLLLPDYLFDLSPKGCGVWEIRSKFQPQVRVLGMFVFKDGFLATHFVYRNKLGGLNSRRWGTEISKCKSMVHKLIKPFTALKSSVISGAMNEKYFKS